MSDRRSVADRSLAGPAAITNAVLAFALEIGLLVALAYAGWQAGGVVWQRVALMVALPGILAVLWGVFAAPTSKTRLSMPWILLFKIVAFGSGAVALYAADQPVWAVGFGVLSAGGLVLATAIKQV